MDPDSDSPVSRMERTLWSIWYYITGAVNRFLRPEPTDIVSNDPNSVQESAGNTEHADSRHMEGNNSRGEVDEEQPLAVASLLSSSGAVVAWEFCTKEIDLGPDEERTEHKTQLSGGSESKASEEDESAREGQFSQTEKDDAGLLTPKHTTAEKTDDKEEENIHRKMCTHLQVESPENDESEAGLLNLADDGMSEDVKVRRKAEAEEETHRTVMLNDHEKMNETMSKIQVTEEDKYNHEDEQDLEGEEDTEIILCTITDSGLEEEDNMYIEDTGVQRDDANTAVMNEEIEHSHGVLHQASEIEKSYEGDKADNPVCEHLSENDVGVKVHVMAHKSESDKAEDELEEEDENILHEREQCDKENMNKAKNEQLIDEEPEQEEDIKTVREDSQEKDILNECSIDDLNAEPELHTAKFTDEEEEDVAKNTEMHKTREADDSAAAIDEKSYVTTTDVLVNKMFFDARDAEEETLSSDNKESYMEIACTKMNETMSKIQVTEEDNYNHEDEQDLEGEEDTEIKLCTITDSGLEEEDNMYIEEPELHTAKFTDEEEEDVAKNTEMQTKTREADDSAASIDEKSYVTTTDVLVNKMFFDARDAEEETLSSDNKESYMEIACTKTLITIEPEAETGQEICGELKNILLRTCEGRVVVSQELNSQTCEETQEGVPEYNNEPGPDENATQRFLEVVGCEEIQAPQLPEEVESLQNSSCSTGADHSLVEEHMEEEQESTEDINKEHFVDIGLFPETETPLLEQVIQESGLLFEEGNLLVHAMKTDIENSEKEFKTRVGLTDESDETTTGPQDGTEKLLVEFEMDEELSQLRETVGDDCEMTGAVAAEEAVGFTDETPKFVDAEEQMMADTSFFRESVNTISLDQYCNVTPSLLEDITESGFLEKSIETKPKILEDCTVDIQHAVTDSEETGYEFDEAERDEMQNKDQMGILNLQLVEPTELTEKNEIVLTAKSEVDEAFEISNMEMVRDTEAADDLMTTEPVTESEGCYTVEESGHQYLIDEEILDLWIQVASSDNTDDLKQQQVPEQMDTKIELSSEEQAGMSSVQIETKKDHLVKSNSGESGLVSDTEMFTFTAETGFLDQSFCEWDTQNSETQPLKSTGQEPFQDISESTDISDLSAQPVKCEYEDVWTGEAAETGQSGLKEEESVTETAFHPDSGVTSSEDRHQNQESDKSLEKSDSKQIELVLTETSKDTEAELTELIRTTDWKDTEEADFKSPTKMGAEKVEKTNFEDEPLELTASHSPDEFKHIKSGQSSSFEVLSDKGIMSTKHDVQVDAWSDSEKPFKLPLLEEAQPRWLEDVTKSIPEQNRAEVVEQLMTKSKCLIEVDTSALDFTAQRSRIAVKNPRIRPPKDPRSLLHMPSVEPTPSSNVPIKIPAGVPLGGLGIGIKLPGLGAGFPVLKKTQGVVREENSPKSLPQEPETKPEDKSDTPQQDEVQHKPRWMPPKHPGFGNPLMSELKTKLKKPTKE